MSSSIELWNTREMRFRYGSFYDSSPTLKLAGERVPEKFRRLSPYAEFWGISDDLLRESLVMWAPAEARQNLKAVVAAFDNALDEWLAGPEADDPYPSDEYVAFTALRMAADFI
jgi:hypothetical protein